jgi:hypothetical protein
MLDEYGRLAFEAGVALAEEAESALVQAVKTYAAELKIGAPAYDRARQHYWTSVEQNLPDLFAIARDLIPKAELPKSAWGLAVRAAGRDAYAQTCPCLTPRQIQAFALGLKRFFQATSSKTAKPNKPSSHE